MLIQEQDLQPQNLQQVQEAISSLGMSLATTMYRIGQLLVVTRDRFFQTEEGFVEWLKSCDFPWKIRTSYSWIRLARQYPNLSDQNLGNIQKTALYLLSAEGAPEGAMEVAIAATENGHKVSFTDAKNLIAAHEATTPQEIEAAYLNIEHLTVPSWEQLVVLYEQVGMVFPEKEKDRYVIELDGQEDPLIFQRVQKEEAWEFWYKNRDRLLQSAESEYEEKVAGGGFTTVIQVPQTPEIITTESYLGDRPSVLKMEVQVPNYEPDPHPAGVIAAAGNCEQYTPEYLWRPGLTGFGIESYSLDPATYADSPIPAATKYTKKDNGLKFVWRAKHLWLNPPYSDRDPLTGKKLIVMNDWINKVVAEHEAGNVENALVLVKSDCRTEWFHNLLDAATGMLFVRGGVRFERPDDEEQGGAFFGSVIFYLGEDYDLFESAYQDLGRVIPLLK